MKSKHKKKASKKKHLADSDQGEGLGERKNTLPPQPPQKRKTQPELLRELEKEMAGRRNKEGIVGVVEGKDTPPLTRANGEGGAGDKATPLTRDPEEEQGTGSDVIAPPKEVGVAKVTDSPQRSRGSLLRPRTQPPPTPPSSKATPTSSNPESDVAVGKVPPPISSKPDRRGTDESEFATPTDDGRGHVAPPTNSDTGVVAVGKERVKGSTTSLRRKPKGPAPAPPPARANTLARTRNLTSMVTLSSTSKESEDSGDVMLAKTRRKTETSLPSYSTSVPEGGGRDVIDQTPLARSHSPMGAGGAMGRSRPSRRAPSRPPPSKPDVGSVKEEESLKEDSMKEDKGSVKEEESVKEDSVKEGSVEGDSVEEGEKVAILEGALKEEAKVSEAKVSETTPSLNSEPRPPHAPPSTLPLDRSPPKQDHQSSPAKETATTICQSSEDGGKVLIVKPSPGSTRRALGTSPIIFKLPPPPPNPPSPDEATPTPKRPVSKEGVSLGSDKPPVSEKPKKMLQTPPKTLPTTSPKTTPTTPPKTPPTTSPKTPPTTSPKTPPIPPKTPPKTPPIPPKTPPKTPPIPPKTPPKTPPTTSPKNSPPKLSPRTSLKSRPKESRGAVQTPSRKPQTSESVLEMSSTPSSLGGHQGVSSGGDLLNATIVSNEFTNFDELSLEDIVTTDFSIEENLEPPKGERDLFHSGIGRRLDSAGMSNTSMSDSECSMGSRDGGFHIQSDDDEALVRKSPRVKHEKTTPTKLSSNHSSPSRSPGRRRPVPPPPSVQGTEVAMSSVLFLNSNNNNNNNNNNNVDSGSDAHSEDEPTGKTKGEWHVYMPRGDVGMATPDDDDMPMEPPSSGEDDSDTSSSSEHSLDNGDADLGSGEIVLISMRQQPLDGVASSLSSHDQERVADIASGSGPVEEGWVEKTESEVQSVSEKRKGQGNGEEKGEGQGEGYRMGDVTLNELDNVVSDLRELVEQSSNQEPQDYSPPSSVSPTTPPSPPPPPPPPSNLPPPPSPPPPTSDLPPPPPPSPPPSSSTSSSSSSSPPTPPLSLNIEDRDVPTLPVSPPPPLTDTHSDEDNVTKESQLNRRIKSRFSKPTPPPLPTAKPRGLFRKKSKPVIDAENADSAKDELFEKMKERQAKLREQAAEPSGEAKSEPGSNSSQQESVSSSNSSQHGSVSGSDSSQQKDSASNSGSNSGGDNVQMQLQFLQQQVIQQQMMQLQQQFQQLLAMNPGINLSGMGMGIQGMGTGVPNMAGAGMGVPNIAGMSAGAGMSVPSMAGAGMGVPNMTGAGMGVAGAGMGVPNMAGAGMGAQGAGMGMGGMGMGVPAMNPSMMNAQMLGMNALNAASLQTMSPQMMPQFQQQAMSGMQVGMSMAPQVGVASQVGVAPQVGVAQNLQVSTSSGHVHQDAGESQDASDDTPTMRKKSECMIERSGVMGNMEGRFDQLMDDIRDTNPHNILKRVS